MGNSESASADFFKGKLRAEFSGYEQCAGFCWQPLLLAPC
jgi:hypothetical protein